MAITINGSGAITGINAGGLPDNCITTADIAAGAVTQAKRSEQSTLGTAVASTSGTSIDFTGIPSWVKRVTVMMNGVSTNGASLLQVQLGTSSGVATSGYVGASDNQSTGGGLTTSFTTGLFLERTADPSLVRQGLATFCLVSSNNWIGTYLGSSTGLTTIAFGSTRVTLSGTLDRVRITTANGTDTFDAGSINIMYE
jgi:hypothetical protein